MHNMRALHALAWLAAISILIAACTQQSTPQFSVGNETLGQALAETGFPCDRVVSANSLSETARSWRIACSNARVYLASLQDDGGICIEPVIYGDTGAPQPIISPQARCVSLS
jgi:hypothetical protein